MLSIGLMSGTSMDGIEAALLETDGGADIKDLAHVSLSYDPRFNILLKAAEYSVCQCKGDLQKAHTYYSVALQTYLKNSQQMQEINIPDKINDLCTYLGVVQLDQNMFEKVVQHSTHLHAQAVKKLLEKTKRSPDEIDVVGYHGQTLFHNPSCKITIQIGDGQVLADQLGITVINDFRSHDISFGGQGAPFAPLYHQALAIRDKKFPVAVLNCGGIANITIIKNATENDVIGFDTGPGNGLIDRYVRQRSQGREFMDENGKYGKNGKVNLDLLNKLRQQAIFHDNENFLDKKPPKSLDINDLKLTPEIVSALDQLSIEDACVTLETFTAQTIVDSLRFVDVKPTHWVLAGGGWKNPIILGKLMEYLKTKINNNIEIKTADEFGWNSQAMEAQIFAHFAVRSLKNLPLSVPGTTGVAMPISGGHAYLASDKKPTMNVNRLLKQNPAVLNGYAIK